MASKVKSTDIYQSDIFADFTKSIDKAITSTNALDKKIESLTKEFSDLGKSVSKDVSKIKIDKPTIDSFDKLSKAQIQIQNETKRLVKIQQDEIKIREKLKSVQKGEQNELIKTRIKIQEETKAVKDSIKARKSLTPQYDKARKKLNQMQKELIEARLGEDKMSKSTRKLAKDVAKLNKQISGAEQLGGRFQRQVGKYPKLLTSTALAAGGAFIGFQAFTRVLGGAVKIAKEFEQSNANLAAVLGKSRSEIGALTEDAKRLGSATSFSASEVSGLQTEFAKLGFNEQEILNATEATLNLAAATGSDISEAAAIAGATLGGFGLSAEETGRVTDVMAKSFSTSALDMEKFKESMKTAAPAAKAVGKSVEETTALLGTLANAGISGSKSGTALKTTFINLNKAGLTMNEGFDKVNKSSNKLGTAVELVGKEAAAAFLVLAGGVDDTAMLQKGLENAGGAAEKMANEQLDTLEGSLKILNSAWEGFVLGLLSGDGAFASISRGIVSATTSLLGFFTAQGKTNEMTFESAKANKELANSSQKLLNEYESLVKDGIEPTAEEKEKLEVITLRLKNKLGDSVIAINEETGAFELNTEAVRAQIKIKRLSFDQEASTLASRLVGVQEDIKLKNETLRIDLKTRDLADKRFDEIREERKGIRGLTEEQKELAAIVAETRFTERDIGHELIALRKEEKELIEELKELKFSEKDAQELINGTKEEATEATEDNTEATEKNNKSKKGLTDAQKAFNKSLKEQISLLKEQQKTELLLAGDNELLKLDLRDEHLNQINALELKIIGQTSNEKKKINAKLNNELLANDIEKVKKQIEFEKKRKEEQDKLNKERLIAANNITQFRLDRAIKDAETIDDIEQTSIEAAENRANFIIQTTKLSADERILIEEQLQAEISDIQKKADEDRLAESKRIAAEENDLRAEQEKELLRLAKTVTGETGKELKKRNDDLVNSLDDEISAIENRINRQEDLAARGLENQVAFEEEKLNEATLNRKEALEKQQRQQEAARLAEVFLTAFEARLQENPNTATQKALVDTFGARAIAKGFLSFAGAFKEGVEDMDGQGTGTSDSNIALVSKGESIATAKATKDNQGLVTAMNKGNVDDWVNMKYGAVSGNVFNTESNDNELLLEMKKVNSNIANLPTSDITGDKVNRIIQTIRTGGNKRIVKHRINPVQ